MPMLYGEGGRAFERLQEEIMRKSRDQSIIASGYRLARPSEEQIYESIPYTTVYTALAASPGDCLDSSDVRQRAPERPSDAFVMAKRGLGINLPTCKGVDGYEYCILNCGISTGAHKEDYRLIAVPLVSIGRHAGEAADTDYARMTMQIPILVPRSTWEEVAGRAFYIRRAQLIGNKAGSSTALAVGNIKLPDEFFLAGIFPPQSYPFMALELASTQSTGYARALLHIARRDPQKHGVVVLITSQSRPDIAGKYLDAAQKPAVAATHVSADFCILDFAAHLMPGPVSLEKHVIEIISVLLDPAAETASGAVMIELLKRKNKPFLDIDLVKYAADEMMLDVLDAS
ncbi:Uu.00g029380.m01.CDS01 [Anthostomella pinea]|uniref:Uu.00g029380.m01.CDS01 n=1 Tax=Anthostomella pinea TaxID=933095 RepID=A0AAI8YCU8_9PEZI|nr:Uu.00g029380.m01.CDS01 [Anthostomella pinea]